MSNAQATPLPVPDNPEHTDNLCAIALLKQQGFTGQDVNLATSLSEYGLLWRERPEGGWLFVHRASHGKGWDRTSYKADTDARDEWDWVKFGEVYEWSCMSEADWNALPFPLKVADLVMYYGVENVFGTTYWSGFQIKFEE